MDGAVQLSSFVLDELVPGPIPFAAHAVVARIRALIEIPGGFDSPDNLLNPSMMSLLGRPNEVVVADVQDVPRGQELIGNPVDPLLR